MILERPAIEGDEVRPRIPAVKRAIARNRWCVRQIGVTECEGISIPIFPRLIPIPL